MLRVWCLKCRVVCGVFWLLEYICGEHVNMWCVCVCDVLKPVYLLARCTRECVSVCVCVVLAVVGCVCVFGVYLVCTMTRLDRDCDVGVY